jgi:hypothetical protein
MNVFICTYYINGNQYPICCVDLTCACDNYVICLDKIVEKGYHIVHMFDLYVQG